MLMLKVQIIHRLHSQMPARLYEGREGDTRFVSGSAALMANASFRAPGMRTPAAAANTRRQRSVPCHAVWFLDGRWDSKRRRAAGAEQQQFTTCRHKLCFETSVSMPVFLGQAGRAFLGRPSSLAKAEFGLPTGPAQNCICDLGLAS